MSYCRFGPSSDLYVVATADGYQCISCRLLKEEYTTWSCNDVKQLYIHLLDHRDLGHQVPVNAFKRVMAEITGVRYISDEEALEALMYKLASPNIVFNHMVTVGRMRKEFAEILEVFETFNWPPEDEVDD